MRILSVFCAIFIVLTVCATTGVQAQIMYNNGAIIVTKPSSFVQVNGAYTNNTGSIDDSGTVTITTDLTNNTTATAGGSGLYNVGGNFTNNSSWIKKTGTVNLDGISNQNVGGTQITTFYDLQFTNGGSKTLTKEEIVDSNCYFNNGICYTTQTNVLHFDSLGNWVNISGMPVAPCVSYVDGPCEKDMNSTNMFWFPVGKRGRANTCAITPTSATDATFRTQYFNFGFSDVTDMQDPLVAVSGVQYWHGDIVSPNPASTNAIIRLYWIPGDYSAMQLPNPSALVVGRWDTLSPNPPGPTPAWMDAGQSNISPTADFNSGWIESLTQLATQFGTNAINRPFTLASIDGPDNSLPVQMGTFTARQDGKSVLLNWETYSEIESLGFQLERERAGTPAMVLGSFVNDTALMAKSPSGANYQTLDDSDLTAGPYTYYLYQVDKNGIRTEVGTQTIDYADLAVPDVVSISLYPNPASLSAHVNFELPAADHVRIDLYDITGRLVAHGVEGDFPAGPHQIAIDIANLDPGAYSVILTSANARIMRSLIIER
ncbi:MAG TPA: T9SS type A sorting domain-containing protein [Candidatus Kapabacteria bacterium]